MWTPIGSMFSIEHTITTLSLRSRITSSSNSPQPSTDSSSSTWLMGLSRNADGQPPPRTGSGVEAKPPPCPPSVNAGRTTTGQLEALRGQGVAGVLRQWSR